MAPDPIRLIRTAGVFNAFFYPGVDKTEPNPLSGRQCVRDTGEHSTKEASMKKTLRLLITALTVSALVLVPLGTTALAQSPVQASDPSGEAMIVDFVLLRPIGIISLVVGTTFFALSYPFSALGGNADKAKEKLITDPARFTFDRKLGDL
jgi:hypothetical protein